MTAHSHTTVNCDYPGCAQYSEGTYPTATETRDSLQALGWATRVPDPHGGPRKDYCPKHVEAAKALDDIL